MAAEPKPRQAPQGMTPPENAANWYRIQASAEDSDSTDVFVFDSIGGWFGLYADEFIDALQKVTTSKISLRLNSPGGSVFEGIAIANAMRQHPANITVYVESLAASIASVIALAGDRLVMCPQSQIMVHNASGGCYGDASEMTKMADLLDKQSRNIAQAYAQHTGRPLSEWEAYMADETWFTAEEAVAVGLADEAMPMRPKKGEEAEEPAAAVAQMDRSWDLSMYRYAGREQAPEPKSPYAKGGLVPGERLTASGLAAEMVTQLRQIADTTQPVSMSDKPVVQAETEPAVAATPQTITVDLSLLAADETFLNLIRDITRQTITAALNDGAPPFLPKKGEDDEDGDEGEEEAEDASTEEPTDAEQVTVEDAEAPPVEQQAPEEIPPDGAGNTTEPHDEADDWTQVVGFLVPPTTSPSADDVFAQLKEGW